jgi:tetratricopeptide (TPR) repeat protein
MRTRTIGLCLLVPFLALTAPAVPPHVILLKDGLAAARAGDTAAAITKLEDAAKLRPDYPRLQLNLARLYAQMERYDDAYAALQRLADMGLSISVVTDRSLSPLQDFQHFHNLIARLGAAQPPVGNVSTTSIPGVTGILEGLLVDSAGTWYFSDVRNRCIWRRDLDGTLRRFTAADAGLDGVFKLALSPDRKVLWASTAAVGVMTGAPAGEGSRSALVALDFATGRVLARHAAPADGRQHLLGDFLFGADGAIFATDSDAPVIWRLPPGGQALEPWLESDDFLNLQGLAFSADGRTLFVADYSNGLWRIDVGTKKKSLLVAPANATFFGIDGLFATPGGLIAIQNGTHPQRVLLLDVPASSSKSPAARTLALGHGAMTDLSLGTVEGNRFHFIADSGWALFDPAPEKAPPPRAVTVYSIAFD